MMPSKIALTIVILLLPVLCPAEILDATTGGFSVSHAVNTSASGR